MPVPAPDEHQSPYRTRFRDFFGFQKSGVIPVIKTHFHHHSVFFRAGDDRGKFVCADGRRFLYQYVFARFDRGQGDLGKDIVGGRDNRQIDIGPLNHGPPVGGYFCGRKSSGEGFRTFPQEVRTNGDLVFVGNGLGPLLADKATSNDR
jgi:hypothetical protein